MTNRLSLLAAAIILGVGASGAEFKGAANPAAAPKPSPLTAEEQRPTFALPPGFEIELVAADPDIAKIVTVAFDEAGRMWAITAVEYPVDENENPERARALFAGHGRDRVLVFDNPYGPGPHKPRVFADGLAIPLGILPYRDGAFVGHGDKVLFLRDTDGDGKADKREIVLSGFGIQDSHLFPHQFTRGPGDWFYLAQGAFNYSKVKEAGGQVVEFNQTKMARFRADGRDFETVCWGPNNIWGFVITRDGEMFIQEANDLGYPVMPFYIGAAYPGIGMHKPKPYAPFQPPLADFSMGGTGLSGLALAEDRDGFPPPYKDVMYVANPITRKIQAIKIHHEGSDYRLEKLPDFILSSDEWFRPVAIHFGPDSCLYIVDWYNKIISHNEVARDHPDRDKTRGRIWRVRHESMPRRSVPDLTRARDEQLVKALSAANAWEARAARHQIIDRKAKVAPALRALIRQKTTPVDLLVNALWALEGLGAVSADDIGLLATHQHYAVRREAVRIATSLDIGISSYARLAEDAHPQVRAEVVRALDSIMKKASSGGLQDAIVLLVRMAKPSLDGKTVKTQQGGETVKTGEAGHREFERYLVRAALEKQPETLWTVLESDQAQNFPIENRLFASLALPADKAASLMAALWPRANRPLNDEELALLANQAKAASREVFESALRDSKSQQRYLQSVLNMRDRLDASSVAPVLTRVLLSGSVSEELLLKLVAAFRLVELEPQVLAYATRTNLTVEQRISGVRALREIAANHPHLFQQVALSGKPGEPLQREALLALGACKPADAVPRAIEMWPVLSPAMRKVVADRLASSKPGAQAWIEALHRGDLAREEVDEPLLDKLKTILGDDPRLTELQQALQGPAQPVLRLTGKNEDYVDYKLDLKGAFTVEAWIKLDPGINNRDGILGAPGVADFNFHDARLRVWDSERHDVIIAKKQVPAEVWTHVAITRDDDGRFKIYINGELDTDQCTPTRRHYAGVFVCRTSNPQPGGPGAMVTEYRVWNSARSASEIQAYYKTSFSDGSLPASLAHYFSGNRWTKLHGSAQLAHARDYPPLIDQATAQARRQKLEQFRSVAEQPGDLAQGKIVFKNICANCHNVQGEGGQIGPTLNGAGAMGMDALLHSILWPNEAVESGYYVFRVETKDEEVMDGFLVRQDDKELVLRQPNSEDKRLARGEVKRAGFAKTSMMPEGLLEGIPAQDVSHLFAYLKTLK
jgi:putative heme-binding domain-containing protein